MADATGTTTAIPNDTTATTQTAGSNNADKMAAAIQRYQAAVDKMGTILDRLSGTLGSAGGKNVDISKFMKALADSRTDLSRLQSDVNSFSTSNLSKQFDSFGSTASSSLGGVSGVLQKTLDFIGKQAGKLGEMLGSAGIIGATKFQSAIVQKLGDATGYNAAQAHLMEVQRSALQMGTAFNGSLEDAQGGFNSFNRTLRESIITTRSMPDAILSVRNALGQTFGPNGVMENIKIPEVIGRIHSSLNLTNVALLTAKATGTSLNSVTDLMIQNYTELGGALDDTALAFGTIKNAADQSGIGFDKTLNSIQKSADALKFWGGTINSVTPLFDMFSRSLAGTGRQGLTPQLLQSFVSGLERMSTSSRALLGLQGGMGGRGGAIGAALEMEQALESGPAGMQKVVDNLSKTLTNFTGGKIITRAEAVSDPTMQVNFLAQRQLLQQLLGQDTATATKTLEALSGIQKTGLTPETGAAEGLAKLLGSGEQIANDTTTAVEKSAQLEITAMNSNAANIIREVKALADKLGVGRVLGGSENALEKGAITGQFNPQDIARQLKSAMGERDRIQADIRERRKGNQEVPNELVAALNTAKAEVAGLTALQKVAGVIPRAPRTRNALVEAQPKEITFAPKSEISSDLKETISDLGTKIQSGKATSQEVELYNRLSGSIENLKDLKVDSTPLEKVVGDMKSKLPPEINPEEQINNLRKQIETLPPRELPLPPVQNKTEAAKVIEAPKQLGGNLTPNTPTQKRQEEIIFRVVMDGESSIKLEPIVKQIVAKIYGNNHET